MRRKMLIGIAVGVALTIGTAILVGADAPQPPAAPVGRYEIAESSPSGVWLVDTTSGHVWWRATGADWQDKGSPVPAP
jgi:hypothetical protein